MCEVFLLEKDYREAFLYLLYEISVAKLWLENKKPWVPQDEEQFERSLNVLKIWYPDPWETSLLDFPWRGPREIPEMPEGRIDKINQFANL